MGLFNDSEDNNRQDEVVIDVLKRIVPLKHV